MERIRDLVAWTFFLDRPFQSRPARLAQYLGVGLTVVWIVVLAAHFVARREVSLLLLGLVTLAAWVLLWRIAFLIAANLFHWNR